MGGIALAWYMYVKDTEAPNRLYERFTGAYRLLLGKYYIDEIYQTCIVEPTYKLMRGLWTFDAKVVGRGGERQFAHHRRIEPLLGYFRPSDGRRRGERHGELHPLFSQVFKYLQSGMVQNYLS